MLADVNVGYEVTNLSLSADELTLAVAISRPEHAVVYLYDVRNFATQVYLYYTVTLYLYYTVT